jgi:hypothetical protein
MAIGLLGLLAFIVFLGYFICFIIVLIKQFQDAGAVHGIIGIITCSIWTFIWGWMNATRLNIKKLMMIMTILFIIYIIMYIAGAGAMMSQLYGTPPTPTP